MEQSAKTFLDKIKCHEYYEKYKSLIRFIIVGCINTGVDFVTFSAAHGFLGLDKLICQVAGYGMGTINSFVLNKLWTFENRNSRFDTVNQIVRFVVVNLCSLGISLFGLRLINENYGANIYVSKLIVTGMAQAVNYMGYKLWVFNGKRRL